MKLIELRNEIQQIRTEIRATNKINRKLQLRVQTTEKKLELQQIKEQQTVDLLQKSNEQLEKNQIEQENLLVSVKILFGKREKISRFCFVFKLKSKDEKIRKFQDEFNEKLKALAELERRFNSSRNENKEQNQQIQNEFVERNLFFHDQHEFFFVCFNRLKKQIESLKKRCSLYEENVQQMSRVLSEKQILIDDLDAEKRSVLDFFV